MSDASGESNHAAYVSVGVWHEFLVTRDAEFGRQMWPTVRRAIEFVLGLQMPRGEIIWERAADGTPGSYALLTGCASMYQSLRCAAALGELAGEPQPRLGAGRRASSGTWLPAIRRRSPTRPGSRWTGTTRSWPGRCAGRTPLRGWPAGWPEFVVPGLGVRCVRDEPWVTGAETCELALALDAIGDRERALELFAGIQHLRDADGAYWTGLQFANQAHFPAERSNWTAAAIILAADALAGTTGGAHLFRQAGADRAAVPPPDAAACGCPAA